MSRILVRAALLALPVMAMAQPVWIRWYHGTPNDMDRPRAVTCDARRNVYVTGFTTEDVGRNKNFTTVSYDSGGTQRWVHKIPGTGMNPYAYANAMCCCNSFFHIYATGTARSATDQTDMLTVKYDPDDGDTLWTRRYANPYTGVNTGTDIAVDGSGNVIATGYTQTARHTYDIVTAKYTSGGVAAWTRTYGDTISNDQGYDVAVDEDGYVYVTGQPTTDGDFDIVTIKYRPTGSRQWVRVYSTPGTHADIGDAVAVDPSGNVYVAGQSFSGSDTDLVVLKYDSLGTLEWDRTYDSPGQGHDRATGIVLSRYGGAYVAGTSDGFGNQDDALLIRYSAAGDTAWVVNYDGPNHLNDRANCLCYRRLMPVGEELYVAGTSMGTGTSYDYVVMRLNAAGALIWDERYDGVTSSWDEATAITLDADANVIVTGHSDSTGVNGDFCTMKYPANPVGLAEAPRMRPAPAIGLTVVPNPLSTSVVIRISAAVGTATDLSICDGSGRLVRTFARSVLSPSASVTWDGRDDSGQAVPEGAYFVRLISNRDCATRRVLLIR